MEVTGRIDRRPQPGRRGPTGGRPARRGRRPGLAQVFATAVAAAAGLTLALAGCGAKTAGETAGGGGRAGDAAVGGGTETAASESSDAPEYPHPRFEMTEPELAELLSAAPRETRRAVAERPQYFLELAAQLLQAPAEQLRLVDKEHPLPAEAVPEDLVVLDRYADVLTLNRRGLSLRAVIMPDLLAMAEAARQDGILLPISSTYRSYDYQAGLFERHVENLGEEEAARVSARPGTSQHQLGTTLDFGSITLAFADTAAGRWVAEHAADFGFSMSYPDGYEELTGYSYEPWHFRWIGRTATEMEAAFFGGLQQHMLEFWHQQAETLRRAQER